MSKYPVWWQYVITYSNPFKEDKSYRYKDTDPYRGFGWIYCNESEIQSVSCRKWETVKPECLTIDLPQTITLPVKVSAQLQEELTKYCYERCVEEL